MVKFAKHIPFIQNTSFLSLITAVCPDLSLKYLSSFLIKCISIMTEFYSIIKEKCFVMMKQNFVIIEICSVMIQINSITKELLFITKEIYSFMIVKTSFAKDNISILIELITMDCNYHDRLFAPI